MKVLHRERRTSIWYGFLLQVLCNETQKLLRGRERFFELLAGPLSHRSGKSKHLKGNPASAVLLCKENMALELRLFP